MINMLKGTNNKVMHSYPGLVALVTSKYENKANIMAAGWHTYISYEPPIYGVAISKERFTHSLITNSGEFTINFLPGQFCSAIQASGTITGENREKLKELNLESQDGVTVNSPILQDAYVAYECKVLDRRTYGDHDWIVGSITHFYRDEDKFIDGGLPDFQKLKIPLYVGRSKYIVLDEETELKNHYQG
jgi:flavin reductase (DIM6/NTAB) family NADH-FMN oxidoreductase RutF